MAALWGGGALSFYSVSASHATDRTDSGQIAQVMSGMLFIWAGVVLAVGLAVNEPLRARGRRYAAAPSDGCAQPGVPRGVEHFGEQPGNNMPAIISAGTPGTGAEAYLSKQGF